MRRLGAVLAVEPSVHTTLNVVCTVHAKAGVISTLATAEPTAVAAGLCHGSNKEWSNAVTAGTTGI